MTILGCAFFENVFSPKGTQKNSQKLGVWEFKGFRVYIYVFSISQLANCKLADLRT